jgi:hypothetical protein
VNIDKNNPFFMALAAMVFFAASVRLTWELLSPVLVPMSIVVSIVFVAYVVLRRL